MPVDLIPDESLRAALSGFRVDPEAFEAGVRARVIASRTQEQDHVAVLRPGLQSAAALLLPLELLTGGQIARTTVKLAPAAGVSKLLSYLAFPAISLFLLLGVTLFSVARIRRIRNGGDAAIGDQQTALASEKQWWRDHKWGARLVFAATLAMSWIGATWLLYLFYIVSLGILLYVLTSFARLGLGNRQVVGGACMTALMLLGQMAGMTGIGDQDIHFLDQSVIAPVFFAGVLIVGLLLAIPALHGMPWDEAVIKIAAGTAFIAVLVIPLMLWFLHPLVWPATPARIKAYVESFDRAQFSTASWREWEIVANWTVESKLNPDLSKPRQLFAAELAGEQNPFILGDAFRVGMVTREQVGLLRDYKQGRHFLLDDPNHFLENRALKPSLQKDWVIRASILCDELTDEQRDYLARRLNLGLEESFIGLYAQLEDPLLATQLLAIIGRPVNVEQYRTRVHDMLKRFHSTAGGGFQVAGGFKDYDVNNVNVGSLGATSTAIELMEIYGIPKGLDMNWVRSFLRPLALRLSPRNWIAAVTRDRLERLPGLTPVTWLEAIYYERSMLAAAVLVLLCIYATLISPKPQVNANTEVYPTRYGNA